MDWQNSWLADFVGTNPGATSEYPDPALDFAPPDPGMCFLLGIVCWRVLIAVRVSRGPGFRATSTAGTIGRLIPGAAAFSRVISLILYGALCSRTDFHSFADSGSDTGVRPRSRSFGARKDSPGITRKNPVPTGGNNAPSVTSPAPANGSSASALPRRAGTTTSVLRTSNGAPVHTPAQLCTYRLCTAKVRTY